MFTRKQEKSLIKKWIYRIYCTI